MRRSQICHSRRACEGLEVVVHGLDKGDGSVREHECACHDKGTSPQLDSDYGHDEAVKTIAEGLRD